MPFGRKQKPSEQRRCQVCGKPFNVRASWPSQKFCSHACYAESMRRIHVTKEELTYWYYDLGMTSLEIAERLGCNDRYVRELMRHFGLTLRNKSGAAIDYPCHPFSGNYIEKAYLIGFRLGDLNVYKDMDTSHRICARCGTTVSEQVDLIRSLFEPYGHVNLRQGTIGEMQIECRLDLSFAFLLEKADRIPRWIAKDNDCFWAFTAGYTDAEGYIAVRLSAKHQQAVVEIGSCDLGILRGLSKGFHKRGVTSSLYYKGETSGGNDYYCLTIFRKDSLDAFFGGVDPYLRHADKRARMERAWLVVKS